MYTVLASDLNRVLWERHVTVPTEYEHKEILIDYSEFLGSQLLSKIFDFDYRTLLRSAVTLSNLYNNDGDLTLKELNSLLPMHTLFIRVASLAGMKLYLLYKVKIYLTIPMRIYKKGVSVSEGMSREDVVNIVDNYDLVEDLKTYLDIFKSEDVSVGKSELDLEEIDYEYLSKMLMYYRMSEKDILAIERRPSI